ncbi:hypothetical protein LCGC14_2862330 [marine sediment metagenome]|uniref:Uncharacterized protein n=1 Tax=marine sediment metagenome TaxID=412755 RepID=A0A0F8Y559_9ZZZZ
MNKLREDIAPVICKVCGLTEENNCNISEGGCVELQEYLDEIIPLIRQHIPEDKASKIDEVIVKIWNMSKGDINDEACVRKATLEWAQGELRQLSPKVKLPEERNERTFWGGHNSYARGHNQALQQAKEALKDTLRQVMEMVERKQKDNPYIVISDLRDGYDRGLQTIKQALQQAIEEKE